LAGASSTDAPVWRGPDSRATWSRAAITSPKTLAEFADGGVDAAFVAAPLNAASLGNRRNLRLFLIRQPNPLSDVLRPLYDRQDC
jgi:hypothetical protein